MRNAVTTIARDIAEFEAAGSLAEARARLEREKFDLVLLDLGLPDGSGWELLPLINGLVPPVHVVIFSAQDGRAPWQPDIALGILGQVGNLGAMPDRGDTGSGEDFGITEAREPCPRR